MGGGGHDDCASPPLFLFSSSLLLLIIIHPAFRDLVYWYTLGLVHRPRMVILCYVRLGGRGGGIMGGHVVMCIDRSPTLY